jgi:hypothetical protein
VSESTAYLSKKVIIAKKLGSELEVFGERGKKERYVQKT